MFSKFNIKCKVAIGFFLISLEVKKGGYIIHLGQRPVPLFQKWPEEIKTYGLLSQQIDTSVCACMCAFICVCAHASMFVCGICMFTGSRASAIECGGQS